MKDSRLVLARDRWDGFWFGEGSLVGLGVFRIIMMAAVYDALLRFVPAIQQHLGEETAAYVLRPWNPIFALELLGLGPPAPAQAHFIAQATFVAMWLGLFGLGSRIACAVVAVGFTYLAAVHYSLGKPHHDCVQLTFGLWALACAPSGARVSLDAWLAGRWRRLRGAPSLPAIESAPWAAFPVRVTQVSLAIGYFFAGATKIAIGGFAWANGYTLQAIMLEYRAPWSAALSGSVALCAWMQVGLLAIQTSFPLVFLHRWLRWVYVPGAVLFHLVAMQTMSTGPFTTLWFPLLAAFVPWELVPQFFERFVRSGPLARRLLTISLLLAAAAVVGAVYSGPHGPVALLLAIAPMVFGLRLALPER